MFYQGIAAAKDNKIILGQELVVGDEYAYYRDWSQAITDWSQAITAPGVIPLIGVIEINVLRSPETTEPERFVESLARSTIYFYDGKEFYAYNNGCVVKIELNKKIQDNNQ